MYITKESNKGHGQGFHLEDQENKIEIKPDYGL